MSARDIVCEVVLPAFARLRATTRSRHSAQALGLRVWGTGPFGSLPQRFLDVANCCIGGIEYASLLRVNPEGTYANRSQHSC